MERWEWLFSVLGWIVAWLGCYLLLASAAGLLVGLSGGGWHIFKDLLAFWTSTPSHFLIAGRITLMILAGYFAMAAVG